MERIRGFKKWVRVLMMVSIFCDARLRQDY